MLVLNIYLFFSRRSGQSFELSTGTTSDSGSVLELTLNLIGLIKKVVSNEVAEGSEGQHCIDLAASAYTPPPLPHTQQRFHHHIVCWHEPSTLLLLIALTLIPDWNSSNCGTQTTLLSKTRSVGSLNLYTDYTEDFVQHCVTFV